jgi:hypothetical protein
VKRLNTARIGAIVAALVMTVACSNSSSSETSEQRQGPRLLQKVDSESCPHPYMPIIPGARWQYELGGADAPRKTKAELRVLETSRAGKSITAKISRHVGESKTTVEAFCNDDGASFLSLFIPLGPPLPIEMNYAPSITERIGALIPPLERLRKSEHWEHQIVAHTEQPGGKVLTLDSHWEVKGRFLEEREITVPAGSYKVKQVELTVIGHHRPPAEKDITFSSQVMDPPPMVFTYSLAEGVGVVLIEGEPMASSKLRARWALTNVDIVNR